MGLEGERSEQWLLLLKCEECGCCWCDGGGGVGGGGGLVANFKRASLSRLSSSSALKSHSHSSSSKLIFLSLSLYLFVLIFKINSLASHYSVLTLSFLRFQIKFVTFSFLAIIHSFCNFFFFGFFFIFSGPGWAEAQIYSVNIALAFRGGSGAVSQPKKK